MPSLLPRQTVPALSVTTLNNYRWDVANLTAAYTLVVFYRGLHCPVCGQYLKALNSLYGEFRLRDVDVIAISMDTKERCETFKTRYNIDSIDLGFGLELMEAHHWGLFISTSKGKTSIGIQEPDYFSEPGIFLLQKDQTLYWSAIQTMPFARPHFQDILSAIDFVKNNHYPARGEVDVEQLKLS